MPEHWIWSPLPFEGVLGTDDALEEVACGLEGRFGV